MKQISFLAIILTLFACNSNKSGGDSVVEQDSISATIFDETISDEEYEEPEMFKGGNLCKSEDGCITIQSGVHPFGGTAPDYWAIWTITNEKGTKHELRFEESSYISAVHSILKNDGTKYYIVDCSCKASSSDGYEWIEAYKIVGDSIKQVNVLDGSEKIKENAFDINYCIPDWYFTANSVGYSWLFEYDYKKKDLYVPITDGVTLVDRYEVWHFNGNNFEDHGEQAHKGLHKSLRKYNRLIRYFTTKDYIVRVDSLDSHELRYASWKKPKTIEDIPDIVICGGKRNHYVVAPDELGRCDDYKFTNDGYQYVVNYCEVTPTGEGIGEHHDFLLVQKGNKVVVKQEYTDEL